MTDGRMTRHRVRLVEATPEMLEALSRGPEVFAAVLGSVPPAGWPEFPDVHTPAGPNASTTVLSRLGFRRVGDLDDPEHGPITHWRLERDEFVSR